MRISDWSSDVCSSDLRWNNRVSFVLTDKFEIKRLRFEDIEKARRRRNTDARRTVRCRLRAVLWNGKRSNPRSVLGARRSEADGGGRMNRTPVKSSQIASIGHDPSTNTLAIEFKGGKVYHYSDEIGRASCRERVCQYV